MSEQSLDIRRLARRAEGVAEAPDGQILVPFALPGERVVAEVSGTRGRLLKIETASPERIAPFCRHYGDCGGCQLQHLAGGPYGQWKRALVETAFRQRSILVEVARLIDAHGAGRRRVILHVRQHEGRTVAGFMAARSHDLVDLVECPVLAPPLAAAPELARALGQSLGACDVALTATEGGLDAAVKAERKIAGRHAASMANLCNELDLARLTVNGEIIATRRTPTIRIGLASVVLPPNSFLQATEQGEWELAALVSAGLGKSRHIADLFCGVGPFALRLAEKARVSAFDSDRAAVAALGHSARSASGIKPILTETRDLMRAPLVATELKDFDAVVFDPPRAGAEAQARQIAKSVVKRVAAVSCDPVTLARDAAILLEGGYRLLSVTPVDQFKWSSHVETVAIFARC